MSNYPPGMSGQDFVRAGIDQPHHHEHEFEPSEECPIFEDGAAIFYEHCIHSEGRYGEGWLERIIRVRDNKPNVAYLPTDNLLDKIYEDALIPLECGTGESPIILGVMPSNKYGVVRVQCRDYIMEYRK
jgi:hypothetical protein